MTLYSKLGSFPTSDIDDTGGWVEVSEPPASPKGKEVAWVYPFGWVIRDPMPIKEGFEYRWNTNDNVWDEFTYWSENIVSLISTKPNALVPESYKNSAQNIDIATSSNTLTISEEPT